MSGRILFCATVDYHFKAFHLPYMKWFKEQGWEVHVAASGNMDLSYVDEKYDLPIQRSPFNSVNLRAYKELKAIIDQKRYQIIHCHTPMGGVLARLAARQARKVGTKVIYTAHGFHFCKGAPLLNWMVYYPIEKRLARYTDCLITINEEDYNLAVNHNFKAKKIELVHGVGVDTNQYKPVSEKKKHELRKSYGYNRDDFFLFYAAEFNRNKNQQLLIHALALLKDDVPNVKLLLAGDGPLLNECEELAIKLGVEKMVHFLGYRNDIQSLLSISDVAVASSLREGLPVNIMEAMACGLPVVASENRGHRELIKDQVNGYVIPPENFRLFSARLLELVQSNDRREKMGMESVSHLKTYSLSQVGSELSKIYTHYMLEDIHGSKSQHNRAYI
ncbi:glycosyltransferase family 4 protein [Peribacillus loiseleuriae]|uniref:Glycosyl transferase n=1 Tax=Peribacillus loiseleuriae TaxID=1679170 RepID=A0A0K9GZ68_9BACI|nr:glycosyltransferase family 4 protein [Peribacillus loiseleuriae]KMY51895.1 glycosyl transferase [Peribacillus loiseleuriae]